MSDLQSATPTAKKGAPVTERIVIGIDPGLQRTGYAVLRTLGEARDATLVEAGLIRLAAKQPLAARLLELETCLEAVIGDRQPVMLACEELYAHYKHPRTAVLMAHARGVVLLLAARHKLRVVSVPATQAKKMLTGNGHAGKTQIQRAVAATLGLPTLPEPSDVADAMAIGLTGLHLASGSAARRRGEGR